MATNGNIDHHHEEASNPANSGPNNLSKDEVGWYFVEQYYTTLSKCPEKLHLFYGKHSQFVYGPEAEVTPVAVGRPSIQERIKTLLFLDCKVRISNVDSQGSGECIVIQVIGEISNNADEPKKFVQTFVLAQQPSGYFVLNDIFRYVKEQDEELPEDTAMTADAATATPVTSAQPEHEAPKPVDEPVEEPTNEVQSASIDPDVMEIQQEEVVEEVQVPTQTSVATVEPVETSEATTSTEVPSQKLPEPEPVAQESAEEDVKMAEVPKDDAPAPAQAPAVEPSAPAPAPAPAPVPVATAPTEPEKPKGPPKPMTWANRAAAAAAAAAGSSAPKPVVPLPKTATPAAAVPRAPPVAATAPQPTHAPKAPESTTSPATTKEKEQGSQWETAQTKRQNRPQSISAASTTKESPMAYIKYVTDKVQAEDLKEALSKFGELAYFDVHRQKNCAFAEFATQAGYDAAVENNPHVVNGESVVVEQRRPKANAFGGTNYNASRPSGFPGRGGRGGLDGGRIGSQGNGRGGYSPGQSRGGRGGAGRGGRGGAQAGNV